MKPAKITVVLTMNERPPEVIEAVLGSLQRQGADHIIVVFDGAAPGILRKARQHASFEAVHIVRDPGWICPARAWNMGLARVDTELTMLMSSDVVLNPDAVSLAREGLSSCPAIIYGKCEESDTEKAAADPNTVATLCSSDNPRPLGFIMAMPTWALRAVGGYDEKFMAGFWYDDNDFMARLWKVGLPFVFADKISGYHQTHERPHLTQEGIAVNRAYMEKKWGTTEPLSRMGIRQRKATPGLTIWEHPVSEAEKT